MYSKILKMCKCTQRYVLKKMWWCTQRYQREYEYVLKDIEENM